MSILTQFYLYPTIGDDDSLIAAHRRLHAFHRAINTELAKARIRAPFVKVAVSVYSGGTVPAWVYQGIASYCVDDDPARILASNPMDTRRIAAQWSTEGLKPIATHTGWDAEPVLEMIEVAGRHVGLYRDVRDKQSVRDKSGTRWTPVFEWDESGVALLAEGRDQQGEVVARTILVSGERPWLVDYLPLKLRRSGTHIEYVYTDGSVIGEFELDGTVEVSEEQVNSEDELEAPIPRPVKAGRSDMPLGVFWGLIEHLDWSRPDDDDAILNPLIETLAGRSLRERHAFHNTLARLLYDIDGRAWARQMGLGWHGEPDDFSTDAFVYARCMVVAQGRAYYEAVRRDPSKMRPDEEFEAILYATSEAQERLTGDSDEFETRLSYETFSNSAGWD